MKQTLLLLLLALCILSAKASDTLTIRQVFNFNVGDTFDYSYSLVGNNYSNYLYGDSFQRVVIISKYFSADSDTVTYIRMQIYPSIYTMDTLIYTDLDSSVLKLARNANAQLQVDTTGARLLNIVTFYNYPTTFIIKVGQGLGAMNVLTGSYFYGCNNNDYSYGNYYTTLVYYSNGVYQYGQPYQLLDGTPLIHYIPIPEDCAFWNYTQTYADSINYFQVRTGNKLYFNNHTYVELILRSVISNIFSTDSLVGYFRNDSVGFKVYFCSHPGINELPIYDFSIIDAGKYTFPNYMGTIIDTIWTGNTLRTIWNGYIIDPADIISVQTISGIGTSFGLFHAPEYYYSSVCGNGPTPIVITNFCVCGQTLYPDTATGQSCALLTGVNTIFNNFAISVSPNPSNNAIHLSISELNGTYQFTLTNLLSQDIFSQPVTQTESSINIASLTPGIYLWRLMNDGQTIKTGKIVKE